MKKLGVLAAAACLMLAACGSDDGGGAGGAQGEVSADLMAQADGEITQEQADCAAGVLIDGFGEDEARAFAADPDGWEPDIDPTDIAAATEMMQTMSNMITECDLDIDGEISEEDLAELDAAIEQLEDLDLEDFDIDIEN